MHIRLFLAAAVVSLLAAGLACATDGAQHDSRVLDSWAFPEGGKALADVWEEIFPILHTGANGEVGIASVGGFPANNVGLHDMIGNVWE